MHQRCHITGANLLAGFGGELDDLANSLEAAALSAGGGQITAAVFERARGQLVSSRRVGI